MNNTVILKLGKGQFSSGFVNIIVQIWKEDNSAPIQVSGSLPPNLELVKIYQHWSKCYQFIATRNYARKCRKSLPEIEFEEDEITHISDLEFEQLSQNLKNNLNLWLASSEFNRVEQILRTKLNPLDCIRLIIETEDELLQKIPWHLWQFCEDYPYAEVSLSSQEYEEIKPVKTKSSGKVRILAILGNSEGIDVAKDQELLENLPNVDLNFLVQPNRQQLDQSLWDKNGWDIFFFAGHSYTEIKSSVGYLELSPHKTITIKHLKNALKAAINNGLTLAIFNSCDGLGLGRQLHDLNIPQLIVMREPIPDLVAQEFLKNFLITFSEGQSFYRTFREAREKLAGLEDDYPCASWLPVICQNPAINPPSWQKLSGLQPKSSLLRVSNPRFNFSPLVVGGSLIMIVGLLMGLVKFNFFPDQQTEDIMDIIRDDNNSAVQELPPHEVKEEFEK